MKKSSLLSLLTAGAVIATTAGTFAAWDQLTASSTGSISVTNNKVVVAAQNLSFAETNGTNSIVYEGTAKFTVENASELTDLTLTPTVTSSKGTDLTGKYTVELVKDGDAGFSGSNGTYTDTTVDATNDYKVKVTVTDESVVGETLNVSVAGVAK